MSLKHLIQLIVITSTLLAFVGCSRPDNSDRFESEELPGKFSDVLMKEIHELKHNRKTLELLEFLKHPEAIYRAESAMALGSVQDSTSTEALLLALNDDAAEVRMMAAFALGQLRSKVAAEGLVSLIVRDTTTEVRTEALEALGKTGNDVAGIFLLDYEPKYLFDEAGKAWGIYHLGLAKTASSEHAEQMVLLLDSEYEETRLAAAHFFGRFVVKFESKGLDRLLNVAATDPSEEVRMAAARALGHHNLPDRGKVLAALITYDQSAGVRTNAIRALEQARLEEGHDVIFGALDDGNPQVALTAAAYFQTMAKSKDIERLTSKALVHPMIPVQATLYAALLQLANTAEKTQTDLSNEIKAQIFSDNNVYAQAMFMQALVHDPRNAGFLDSVIFSGNLITSTTALETYHALIQRFGSTKEVKTDLMTRLLNQQDSGLLAYAGVMLRDEKMEYAQLFQDYSIIENLMSELKLPQELEAWIELNNAQSYLTGNLPKPHPEIQPQPINWELIQSLGAQPEVLVNTSKGKFKMLLLHEDAPATVSYFLELVEAGYFDGKAFHRMVPNFVVQTGCSRGDGYGSSDALIRSEFTPLHYGPGVVGMASAGKDTESSQWFVTHCTTPHLDGRYTIFAAVTSGMEVVQQLQVGDVIERVEMAE
jgi:cyclophilin family peptidyl-prolyl cis-trans isomerase/HEAT repeat protein